jgi:DNA-binding phage protein
MRSKLVGDEEGVMTERQVRSYRAMSAEQRAAVDRIRARHATAEHRDEEERTRALVEAEFPPVVADAQTAATVDRLRLERQRQRLSLDEVSERSGVALAALSRLEHGQGNPTLTTLNRVAAALGMRLEWTLVETGSDDGP